MEENQATTKSH